MYERVVSPLMKLVFTYCATKHKIVDLEKQVLHVAHHFHKPRYVSLYHKHSIYFFVVTRGIPLI